MKYALAISLVVFVVSNALGQCAGGCQSSAALGAQNFGLSQYGGGGQRVVVQRVMMQDPRLMQELQDLRQQVQALAAARQRDAQPSNDLQPAFNRGERVVNVSPRLRQSAVRPVSARAGSQVASARGIQW